MNQSRIETDLQPVRGSRRQGNTQPKQRKLHRIAEVLQQEGLSLRTVAHRMHISTAQARVEMEPQRDLRLSELFRWQAALRVPALELLTSPESCLSPSIQLRAKLLKLMKTVRSIQQRSTDEAVGRLAAQIESELTNLMPELKNVASWPSIGQRRTLDELGAIVERVLPESMFGSNPHGDSPSSSGNG